MILQKRPRKNPVPTRGMTVEEEIQFLQTSTDLLIPRAPFHRLIREILQDTNSEMRIAGEAVNALQESSEMYITQLFEDATLVTITRKCVTVEPRDLKVVQYLQRK